VLHAAIAVPRPSDRSYHVDPRTLSVAVRNAFRVASGARESGAPLRSICFPLFGSGCAALPRQQSLDLLLASLTEMPVSEGWDLHLLTLSGAGIDYGPWQPMEASG